VSLEELALTEEERRQLHTLQRLINRLDSRWDSICAVCANAPRTLVHGDLSGKNLRLRKTDAGPQIVALDWETAGWGPPAADLPSLPTRAQRPLKPGKLPHWDGTVPLGVYAAGASGLWRDVSVPDLERLTHIGTVFCAVAGARWSAEQLRAGGGMKRLIFYVEYLPRAMALVHC
jgi:aminoglycoside phosphotransferase (APT) family kinase protein